MANDWIVFLDPEQGLDSGKLILGVKKSASCSMTPANSVTTKYAHRNEIIAVGFRRNWSF